MYKNIGNIPCLYLGTSQTWMVGGAIYKIYGLGSFKPWWLKRTHVGDRPMDFPLVSSLPINASWSTLRSGKIAYQTELGSLGCLREKGFWKNI